MLELKDVDFVRDGKPLLSGVSLTAGEGERWALLGPNGAGKSTLLGLCGAVGSRYSSAKYDHMVLASTSPPSLSVCS